MEENFVFDAIVIGGGPAGAQCTLWMTKLGLKCCLIEREQIGGLQTRSPYTNSWLSAVQATTKAQDVARNIETNLKAQDCHIIFGDCLSIDRDHAGFRIEMADRSLSAKTCVIATGTREVDGGILRSPNVHVGLVDVASGEYAKKNVAILGGGDAACEAYHTVQEMGAADIRLFARTVRARADLWQSIPETVRIDGTYEVHRGQIRPTNGQDFDFDILVICYGWEPVAPELKFAVTTDQRGHFMTTETMETSVTNLFTIGDVNTGPVPCVATALADGVYAAKAIEKKLSI